MTYKKINLVALAKKHEKKLKKIKVAIFDVDGILTNGQVYYQGSEVAWNRFFYVPDGYGIKMLMEAGIKVGVITGGNSVGVINRFKMLGINYFHYGNEDKREAFLKIKEDMGCEFVEMLYMGDEFFDLPLLKKAGFSATVKHAPMEVLKECDYITERNGGDGAVREVIELIRLAKKFTPKLLDFE